MRQPLPDELVHADETLHDFFCRVSFSRYLNPLNVSEARADFVAGAEAPSFAYMPAAWADDALEMLNGLKPPQSHPFGPMLQKSIDGTRIFVEALSNRSASAFSELMDFSAWRPDAMLLKEARSQERQTDGRPFTKGADALVLELREALSQRHLSDWTVELDSVMSARVLVDSAKRVLRVNSRARFRDRDTQKLIAHEIDVHAMRAVNGQRQPLWVFSTGLPGSLETEEGLALYAEECVQASSPGNAWRQGLVVQAVSWAEEMGFRELYERLLEIGGSGLAWGIALRVKRGLKDPSQPGVYGKDVVYFRGLRTVRNWLASGGDIQQLYVGKVSVEHPVQQWLDAGLIEAGSLPEMFSKA